MDEGEMDRLDGLPPSSRSRSASVASSVEPLFSPIPFIARDEHPLSGNDGQEEDGIPDLELEEPRSDAHRWVAEGGAVDVAPVPAEPSEEGDGDRQSHQRASQLSVDATNRRTCRSCRNRGPRRNTTTTTSDSDSGRRATRRTPRTGGRGG